MVSVGWVFFFEFFLGIISLVLGDLGLLLGTWRIRVIEFGYDVASIVFNGFFLVFSLLVIKMIINFIIK